MKHAIAALVLLTGCSKTSSPPPAPPPAATTTSKEFRPPAKNFLSYKTPPEWVSEELTDNMRKAQYRVPPRDGKGEPAQLTFFRLGSQPIETITDYWREKMGGADAGVTKIKEAAVPTTLVDLAGDYTGDNPPLPNARFLGAIVETGEYHWYLKFVGPAETVAGWKGAFIDLLKGLRPIE